MKYVLSELLINELDQLEQLTSSLVNGNVSYDEVLEQVNMTKREKIL